MNLDGKLVLVTGADGFIGSHLVELLAARGCRVRALSYYNSFNHWGWLDELELPSSVEVHTGDIRDPFCCMQLCEGVEVVIHLAALIAIPYSYQAPASYVETNVTGSLNLCEAARAAGCSRFVQVSTSEVYGTARYTPMDEAHPLQAQSPYSASKIGGEAIAMSYYHSFELPVTVVRPFNTYGPRQSARAVIPAIITQLLAGKKRIQLGDLRPTRDFSYVTDTCGGIMALAQCEAAVGEVVNLGTGRETSIGELVKLIGQLMGVEVEVEADPRRLRPTASEVMRLCSHTGKLQALTGFKAAVELETGLKSTIGWLSQDRHFAKYKAELYNV
ncbi:MAG: NAD-dependent epimerase/dehydratase family protein [Bacteroidetes bacterium]|nr:MAG: NAD-dependent epimerase/dehydratase family protein [Bacteroidota bacterium]